MNDCQQRPESPSSLKGLVVWFQEFTTYVLNFSQLQKKCCQQKQTDMLSVNNEIPYKLTTKQHLTY